MWLKETLMPQDQLKYFETHQLKVKKNGRNV